MYLCPKVLLLMKSNYHSFNVSVSKIVVNWDFDLSSLSLLAVEKKKVPHGLLSGCKPSLLVSDIVGGDSMNPGGVQNSYQCPLRVMRKIG